MNNTPVVQEKQSVKPKAKRRTESYKTVAIIALSGILTVIISLGAGFYLGASYERNHTSEVKSEASLLVNQLSAKSELKQ